MRLVDQHPAEAKANHGILHYIYRCIYRSCTIEIQRRGTYEGNSVAGKELLKLVGLYKRAEMLHPEVEE